MAQALYRRWRSQTFDEVVGQEHVTTTLRNALRDGRVAHAYLFAGPRGTGKTSTARILAKALNCTGSEDDRPCDTCLTCVAIREGRMIDLIEIDAASNNSVDDIRELRDKVGFRPSEGRYKIYIIDEVHMLSPSAFNALLKTLEEPPPHARFVLATTEPHKIPATVLSRCQRFDFRRIPTVEIVDHLQHIVDEEKFQAEEDALIAIARSAQGCMRDAISLLDQMFSYGAEKVTLDQVRQVLGAVSAQSIGGMVDALAAGDVAGGLRLIQQLVVDGSSLTEFCHQVVEHLRGVMVLQMTQDETLLADLPDEVITQMSEQAASMNLPATLFAVKCFSEAIQELKGGTQPQLPLELALIESIQGPQQLVVAPPTAGQQAAMQADQATPGAAQSRQQRSIKQAVEKPKEDGEQSKASESKDVQDAPLDEDSVRRLRQQWNQFLNLVKDQCGIRVQAALNAVKDIKVSEQRVAMAFGNNTFSREMIDQMETRTKVAGILAQFLDRSVQLECQMGMEAQLSGIVGTVGASSDDGSDPLVEYAVTNLGAKVVE